MYSLSKCRRCGRRIKWIRTADGKNVPVDVAAVWVIPQDRGGVFYTNSGDVLRGLVSREGEPNAVRVFRSHFLTCPEKDTAEQKRKNDKRREYERRAIREQIERERALEAERAAKREAKAREEAKRRAAEEAQFSLFKRV